jgi:hypothetical protein
VTVQTRIIVGIQIVILAFSSLNFKLSFSFNAKVNVGQWQIAAHIDPFKCATIEDIYSLKYMYFSICGAYTDIQAGLRIRGPIAR